MRRPYADQKYSRNISITLDSFSPHARIGSQEVIMKDMMTDIDFIST
jgi:hypothetical protein